MITKIVFFTVFIFFFICNCNQTEQKPTNPFIMKNFVTDSKPLIGDIVEFHLQIQYFPEITVDVPDLKPLFHELEIRDYSFTKEEKQNYILKSYTYYITSFSDSAFVLSPVTVKYEYENETIELPTQEIFIQFRGLDADLMGDIREITDIFHWKSNYLNIIIVVLLIIVVIIFLILLYNKYIKKESSEINEIIKLSPVELARKRLTDLKEKKYIENDLLKPYYFEITEIFKEFLENIYETNILEMTTDEILSYFRKNKIKYFQEISEYFNITDIVKYAKYKPAKAEANDVFKKTNDLIEELNNEKLFKQLDT